MTTIKIEQTRHDHLLERPPLFHPEYGNPYIHKMLTEDPCVSESIDSDGYNRVELNRLAALLEDPRFYPISLREEITLNELVIYFTFGRIRRHLLHLDTANRSGRIIGALNERWRFELIPSTTICSFPPISKKQYGARELFKCIDDSSSVNMSHVAILHEAREGEIYESSLEPKEPAASTHYTLKKQIRQFLTTDGVYSEEWEAEPYFDGMNYSSPNPKANLL